MTTSLKVLLEQKAALEAQIKAARDVELAGAITQVRALVEQFDLDHDQIFGRSRKTNSATGSKVAAKYRDPVSGNTWSGRGKPPIWIAGKDRAQFEIAAE